MSNPESRHGWLLAGFSLSALLLVTLGLYHHTVLYLARTWNQIEIGEYAHGYLVLAISGYLILRSRRRLSALTPCPHYRALVAVMVASLLWMVAALVNVEVVQAAGLLLLVVAVVWAVLGNRVAWILLLPLLFIGFAIPIWFPLSPVLQDITADTVFWAIRVGGIPAFREGTEIILPAGISSITEACSGLRYLLPALALGTLYGYLNYSSLRARLLVVLIAAVAAVLVNLLRVFIVVYLGYKTAMQHPWVDDHLVLGWYLFGGVVFILLVLDALMHRRRQSADPVANAVGGEVPSSSCRRGGLQYLVVAVAGAALLSVGPAAVYWVNHRPTVESATVEFELPSGTGGWTGPVVSTNDWMPEYRGAISRKQAYQSGDQRVDLYIGYYPTQRQGEELINDLNRISNKDVWRSRNPRGRLRQIDDHVVLEQLLEKGGGAERRLVWYWYRVAGRQTIDEYQAKALQVLGLVTGRPEASVVAIATELQDDADHAREVLREFLSTMKTQLVDATGPD